MKKNSTKDSRIPRYKYIIAVIISIFIVVFPWISRVKILALSESTMEYFPSNNGFLIDFFIYYKEIVLIVFSLSIVMFFVGEHIFPDKKYIDYPLRDTNSRNVLIIVAVFIMSVCITSVLTKYNDLVLFGSPTEGEGILTLIAYMILFLATFNYISNKKAIDIFKKGIIVLSVITIGLALIEFLYKPLFEIPIFRDLLGGTEYKELLSTMENKQFKDMIALTLYNPNYLGGLATMLFPFSYINLFSSEKNNLVKWIYKFVSIGIIFVVIGSKSTASLYVLIGEIVFITLIYRQNIIKGYKYIISYLILLLVILFSINIISDGKLVSVVADSFKNNSNLQNKENRFLIKDIIMKNDNIEIVGEEDSFNIFKKDKIESLIEFYDKSGDIIKATVNENISTFDDKRFESISVEFLDYGIVVDLGYRDSIEFYITEDGFKGVGQNGKVIDTIKIEERIGTNVYHLATGRGYTWVNSIPLLKKSIFFGIGPGAFAMEFPQNDYVGLMNTHGSAKFVIDKPHNMYLQIFIQLGGIAFISFILLIFIFSKKSVKMLFKSNKFDFDEECKVLLGVFFSVCAYLVTGLVNDNIVTLTPVFWIIFGSGFGIMYFLEKKK